MGKWTRSQSKLRKMQTQIRSMETSLPSFKNSKERKWARTKMLTDQMSKVTSVLVRVVVWEKAKKKFLTLVTKRIYQMSSMSDLLRINSCQWCKTVAVTCSSQILKITLLGSWTPWTNSLLGTNKWWLKSPSSTPNATSTGQIKLSQIGRVLRKRQLRILKFL